MLQKGFPLPKNGSYSLGLTWSTSASIGEQDPDGAGQASGMF